MYEVRGLMMGSSASATDNWTPYTGDDVFLVLDSELFVGSQTDTVSTISLRVTCTGAQARELFFSKNISEESTLTIIL